MSEAIIRRRLLPLGLAGLLGGKPTEVDGESVERKPAFTKHTSDHCAANESHCDPAVSYNAWEISVHPDAIMSRGDWSFTVEERRVVVRECGMEDE